MSEAHWSPNLSVGVEEMDRDHQELIEMLSRLESQVGSGAHRDTIAETLDALTDRTARHFRREEALMAREHYPESAYHAKIHRALIDEVEAFRAAFRSGMEIGPEITEFIKRWLISHIIDSDKHLGGYIAGRRTAV